MCGNLADSYKHKDNKRKERLKLRSAVCSVRTEK